MKTYSLIILAIIIIGCKKSDDVPVGPSQSANQEVVVTDPITLTYVDYIAPSGSSTIGTAKWQIQNVSNKTIDSVWYKVYAVPVPSLLASVFIGSLQSHQAFLASVPENRTIKVEWK
jgi:hypothetical protein